MGRFDPSSDFPQRDQRRAGNRGDTDRPGRWPRLDTDHSADPLEPLDPLDLEPFDIGVFRRRKGQPSGRSRRSSRRSPAPTTPEWLSRSLQAARFKLSQLPDPRQVSPTPQRVVVVGYIMLAAVMGLVLRLIWLQGVQGPELTERARQQQQVTVKPFAPRRSIVDRRGTTLALDRVTYTLYAHPKLFNKPKSVVAALLAPILQRSGADIEAQLNRSRSGIRLHESLSEDMAQRVRRTALDGLELTERPGRIYPQNEMVAESVGYVNLFDGRGKAGLEYSMEQLLERSVGSVTLERAPGGYGLPRLGTVESDRLNQLTYLDDLQLQLTLDLRLQRAARSAIQAQMAKSGAKKAAAIVMDVRTGAIRALVCEPTYDPNHYAEADIARFRNWAISDLYEPGSTFKPLVIAMALDSKAIDPNETFDDRGSIRVEDRIIRNFNGAVLGTLDLKKIIQTSSNVGTVQIGLRLNPTVFYDYLKRLGFNRLSGVDLPFETPGQIKDRDSFVQSKIDRATTAFGQGVAITPLQMVRAIATLGNGGMLVTPHVVDGLTTAQGDRYWRPTRPAPVPVFSEPTARAVLSMMESVVTQGTGKLTQIPGYAIAGKTGTSQKKDDRGGYRQGAVIASFAGIFPARSPRYVVMTLFDEPPGGSGGVVAAPAARPIFESLITLDSIPPQ